MSSRTNIMNYFIHELAWSIIIEANAWMVNYKSVREFTEQYNNHNRIVMLHKPQRKYMYTHTHSLVYSLKVVRVNNSVDSWIILNIILNPS